MVSAAHESKERCAHRLLTESVLLSIDDGRRLVAPDDHLAVFDDVSDTALLLGPAPPGWHPGSIDLGEAVEAFMARALRLEVTPVLLLSFRGGLPSARLTEERSTVTTALRQMTDRRSTIGPARASGMALCALEDPDDALLGVFERERAGGRDLSLSRTVDICEHARAAFWRAGLGRPGRSTDALVRRLWAGLQASLPFVEPASTRPLPRLGYAADMLLGGCLSPPPRNAPAALQAQQPRRLLGVLDRSVLTDALPEAPLSAEVLAPTLRLAQQTRLQVGKPATFEAVLDGALATRLGLAGRRPPRGPLCLAAFEADGLDAPGAPLPVRIGELLRMTLIPQRAGIVRFNVHFFIPGLDTVAASHTFPVHEH